jgi:hypothetical protein
VALVKREVEETSSEFLERLREVLIKHTDLNPDAYEGQLILKDKFITQSAPDKCKKLQKSPRGPEDTLDNLLKLTTKVFYSREEEEEELQAQKLKQRGKAETLVAALRENGFKQRGEQDSIYFWWNKPDIPQRMHREACPICRGDHWRTDCPKG